MSILNVDKIQPIGSGSTVTVNATDTILTNAQAGVITATSFSGPITDTGKLRIDISSTGGVGSGNAEGIFLRNTNETDNNAVTIFGGADDYNAAASAINFINVDHSANYGDISFDTRGSGGYRERLRILSSGEVRITKTTTNAKITLSRNESVGTDNTVTGVIDFANNTAHTTNSRIQAVTDGTGNVGGQLLVETRDPSNSILSERLRITGAGLVGISTNAPSSALLDIATDAGSNDHLRLRRLSSDSNVATNWSLKPYAGNLYFREGGSSDKIYFDDNGDIVIMDGNLVIGSANHGIDFSTQTASSASGVTTHDETLDHFEEGIWTPTQATIGSWASGAEIDGKYQRVGNWVTASFTVKYASNGSGHAASIDGLPFANNNSGNSYKQGGFVSYATNSNVSSLLIENGGTRIYIYTNTGSTYALTNMDNVEVRGTVIYRVA